MEIENEKTAGTENTQGVELSDEELESAAGGKLIITSYKTYYIACQGCGMRFNINGKMMVSDLDEAHRVCEDWMREMRSHMIRPYMCPKGHTTHLVNVYDYETHNVV